MSDFRIKTYVLGGVSTNCYLVFREGEKAAVIIDPADNADYLKNKCREFGVEPEAVLLTHAHFDHMLAADVWNVIFLPSTDFPALPRCP